MRVPKAAVVAAVVLASIGAVVTYRYATEPAHTPHSVTLTWDPVPRATFYKIYRRTEGTEFAPIGESETTTYVDQSLPGGGVYFYGVSTVRGGKESDISTPVRAEVPKD